MSEGSVPSRVHGRARVSLMCMCFHNVRCADIVAHPVRHSMLHIHMALMEVLEQKKVS